MKTKTIFRKKIYLLLSMMLFSLASTASTNVYLKFFIQGYWDGVSAMRPVRANQSCGSPNSNTVTCLVTVELHTTSSPYNVVESKVATLNTNGTCTATFTGTYTGSYFIAVKYCNILETWSAAAVNLTTLTAALPYDFSTSLSKAYDDNLSDAIPCMAQISTSPARYAFFSGDITQDGNIGLSDLALITNDVINFSSGCLCTDINGDGNVDLLDIPTPETNVFQWMKRPY